MPFQPLTIWTLSAGPNSWKVVTVLEELGLPYKIDLLIFADVKKPEFIAINPNGRVPAMKDPNSGGLILWESGAIVEYLIETYDKQGKISYVREEEMELKWQTRQWLAFQISGQGPYFGQATW
jgi:glutathione S-transferase